jgi:coenzyme F420-0:L-glutamate ligase / coenzyme F420-1:gamma-L-glutamate ligase
VVVDMSKISIIGLKTIPEVHVGDDIANLIIRSCVEEAVEIVPGDIVVIASKIVSKSEGRVVDLRTVNPSPKSKVISKLTGKDPALIELIRRQSKEIVAAIPIKKIAKKFPVLFENLSTNQDTIPNLVKNESTMLIVKMKHGLASEAGIDYSNNPKGFISLLPLDPNESAYRIRRELIKWVGGDLAVVITDTEIAFTHAFGSIEVAIGFSGIRPVAQDFGSKDRFGKEKFGGADIIIDELASAAALLMGQTSEGIPVAIVNGLKYKTEKDFKQVSDKALNKSIWWTIISTIKLRLISW